MSEIDLSFLTAEARRQDCHEFFGWPYELIDMMFKYSKEYYENPWENLKHNEPLYYYVGLYLIRQLSYSQAFASMTPGQQSRKECDEIISHKPCSCLEIGCGSGDLAIYLFKHGVQSIVTEHSGIPQEFLCWRFKKYDCKIDILNENDELPVLVDYIVANSVLDHITNPIGFAKELCKVSRKHIYARPEIDETYDRPAHNKEILKDLKETFRLIKEHNDSFPK